MQKHVLRALGLSLLAAVGLMAFAVVGAQANGKIRILGSEALATGLTFKGVQEGTGTLLVPGLNIEITCTGGVVVEGTIQNGATGMALAKMLHEGCETWGTKTEGEKLVLTSKLPCEILDGGTKTSKHITSKGLVLVILHNGDTYILAEPDPPATHFTTFTYTSGKGCPIPLNVLVSGTVVFKLVTGDLALGGPEVLEPLVEGSKPIGKLFEPTDRLLYGAQTAYIDGSAKLRLTGVNHESCTWGAL